MKQKTKRYMAFLLCALFLAVCVPVGAAYGEELQWQDDIHNGGDGNAEPGFSGPVENSGSDDGKTGRWTGGELLEERQKPERSGGDQSAGEPSGGNASGREYSGSGRREHNNSDENNLRSIESGSSESDSRREVRETRHGSGLSSDESGRGGRILLDEQEPSPDTRVTGREQQTRETRRETDSNSSESGRNGRNITDEQEATPVRGNTSGGGQNLLQNEEDGEPDASNNTGGEAEGELNVFSNGEADDGTGGGEGKTIETKAEQTGGEENHSANIMLTNAAFGEGGEESGRLSEIAPSVFTGINASTCTANNIGQLLYLLSIADTDPNAIILGYDFDIPSLNDLYDTYTSVVWDNLTGGWVWTLASKSQFTGLTIENGKKITIDLGGHALTDNFSGVNGAAITVKSGSELTLTSNSAGGTINRSGSATTGVGDIIFNNGGTLTLSNVTLDGGSTADPVSGSLIRISGDSTTNINDGTTLQNNHKSGSGGAIYAEGNATLNITGTSTNSGTGVSFNNNKVTTSSCNGGAIYAKDSAKVNITGTSTNSGTGVAFTNNSVTTDNTLGGAIYVDNNTTLDITGRATGSGTGVAFTGNKAGFDGGAIFARGNVRLNIDGKATGSGTGVVFVGNTANGYGGAIDVNDNVEFSISGEAINGGTGVKFERNSAHSAAQSTSLKTM